MRIVHFADSHIGFRRTGGRLTPWGGSQIEADVASTFNITIDRIIALAPDLVVVGGDVVDAAKPPPSAVVTMVSGFAKLARALPNTIVVIAAGNHDLSQAERGAGILTILESLGVYVADRQSKRFYFPDRDISVLAVPDAPGLARPVIQPDPRARFNVLVLHGEVQGMLPRQQGGGRAAVEISKDELGLEAWDYCALGHWHQYREITPNCFYSGSLDMTSSDVWSELATPKGFIERDLVSGAHTFHELPLSRRYLDLSPIDAHGMGPEDVDAAIAAAVESVGGIDDAMARIKIQGITREVSHGLDIARLKEYKKRAMFFHIDERRADRISAESSAMLQAMNAAPAASTATPREGMTVAQRVDRHIDTMELAPDVDRDALRALGRHYLEQVSEGPEVIAPAQQAVA